jgi:hypothetical protein
MHQDHDNMANEFNQLIASGRLQVGAVLYHPKRGHASGDQVIGRVIEGGLEVNGKTYRSLSTAAGALAGHPVNGWTYWRLRSSGETLASLRRAADI